MIEWTSRKVKSVLCQESKADESNAVAKGEVERDLGIFLEGDQVILKTAGIDFPDEEAMPELKGRFNATIAAAVMRAQTNHPNEHWWSWTAAQAEIWIGIRGLDESEDKVDIHELLNATRGLDT